MAVLAFLAGFVAFVLAVFEVTPFGATAEQVIAAGLAFVALGFLIGSLPRTPAR